MGTSLDRYAAPFLNVNDPVVSVVLEGIDQILDQGEQDFNAIMGALDILANTGAQLDISAGRFGLTRMPGETDGSLLTRLAAIMRPRVTPDGFEYHLGLLDEGSFNYIEPGGGSLIAWDPAWAFHYDREAVPPTYTRASSATGPDGSTVGINAPTWQKQSNDTYWAGVFQGTTQLLSNTDFSSTSAGIPTGYAESLLTGDTMAVGTDSTYPISGDSVVTWTHGTTATSGDSTFTSPAVNVTASTQYALSLYINTSGITVGNVSLAVVDASAGTTTVLTTQGVSSGYIRFYGTYTTGTSASTLQLQLQFSYATTGTASFGSPQIEAAAAPTEYLRNSATTGTATRAAETLTYPSSVTPAWGQATIAVAVAVTPASQLTGALNYLVQGPITIWWNGSYGTWTVQFGDGTDNTTLVAPGALSVGLHYLIVRWHAEIGQADFWIDGQQIASTTDVYAPSSGQAVTWYIGSNSVGSTQVNGYVGNLTVLNAWVADDTIRQWSATIRTPIYAATMLQANYENESLASTTGATVFGTSYYLFLDLTNTSATGQTNPFYLDVGYLDTDYLGGSNQAALESYGLGASSILADNLAAGIDPQAWTPGSVQ